MKERMYKETQARMEKISNFFIKEIGSLRVGRASVSLLDGIMVEYYGSKLPISQVATISIPQPQLIVIQPWEKSIIEKITTAIQASNIGLNPMPDASVIRLPIPPLSEERRLEIVKILHKMCEEVKIEIREARRKANDDFKKLEKEKQLSEDDMHKGIADIQKLTDKFIKNLEESTKIKEKEIMDE